MTTVTNMSDRAFVSYARDNQDFVLRLASGLKERGVPVWLDQWDISAGGDWDRAIDMGLHECNQFVIVLSPAAVASKQVRGELQVALDEGKAIVPLLYEACTVPRVLRLIQHIDFTAGDVSEASVLDGVAAALGHVPTRKPMAPELEERVEPMASLWHRKGLYAAVAAVLLALAGVLVLSPSPTLPVSGPAESPLPDPPAMASEYRGKLQVSANIDAVDVSLDGVRVGTSRRTAPLFLTGIKPGRHRITVQSQGYESQEQWVNVSENEWTKAGFLLSPRFP